MKLAEVVVFDDPSVARGRPFKQPAVAYTVDSLALIAGMILSAFASAFRRAFGQSPMSLVKLVRLRRAGELLITTTLPVAEVAKRVGSPAGTIFLSRSVNFRAWTRVAFALRPQ